MATVHFVGNFFGDRFFSECERKTLKKCFYNKRKKIESTGHSCRFLLGESDQIRFVDEYRRHMISKGDVIVVVNPPHGSGTVAKNFRHNVMMCSLLLGQDRVIYFDEYVSDSYTSPYLKYSTPAKCEVMPNIHPDGLIIEGTKEDLQVFNVQCDVLELADMAIEIMERDRLKPSS